MSGVGLVLGAGGLVGQAYHSGILAALENDLGWDPRTADLVVGTSAGALTAALLRTGVSTVDLACWSRGRNWDPSLTLLNQLDRFRSQLPDVNVLNLFRPWHLPGPQLIRHAVSERRSPHLLAMAASVLPTGPTSLLDLMQENPLAWEGQRVAPTALDLRHSPSRWAASGFRKARQPIRPFTARSRRLECDPEPFLCGGRG